jgi:hypothetical protein
VRYGDLFGADGELNRGRGDAPRWPVALRLIGERLAVPNGAASVARMERSAIRVSRTQHNSPGFRFASSGLQLSLVTGERQQP